MENCKSNLLEHPNLSFEDLEEKLEELKISLVIAEVRVNEYCSGLRNQIELKKEKLIEAANKSHEAMVQTVNSYQD
jgi:hypothetical protein